MRSFRAAVVQMNSGSDEAANLEQAEALVVEASRQGAAFVATPENTNFLGPQAEKVRRAESLDGSVIRRFAGLARRLGIHLLLGSFNERGDAPNRCCNTSVLFDPFGAVVAAYRKIHLFDVDLAPPASFTESDFVAPGETCVVAETDLGRIGLSICYDLRFGELYRRLTAHGAEMLTVPSAFTAPTGRAHWEVLLRARAIETQCFVLAPAQWGRHDDDGVRESWGHAMIVDPWGEILASAGEGEGTAIAELDGERLEEVRRSMPVRDQRRLCE